MMGISELPSSLRLLGATFAVLYTYAHPGESDYPGVERNKVVCKPSVGLDVFLVSEMKAARQLLHNLHVCHCCWLWARCGLLLFKEAALPVVI